MYPRGARQKDDRGHSVRLGQDDGIDDVNDAVRLHEVRGCNRCLAALGISDDDIQGLTTVFFEALFDCASKVPVFYSVNNKVTPNYFPEANWEAVTEECKNEMTLPKCEENVTIQYKRTYFKDYITSGGEIPTAITLKFAKDQAVLLKGASGPGIDEVEAERIQQAAKLGGKFSRSLTGLAFGFLNNVNVSFVIGADFAVGDNKTLMHLAQTLAETWSRRVAEYIAWQKFAND